MIFRLFLYFYFFCSFLYSYDSIEIYNDNIKVLKSGYLKTTKNLTPLQVLDSFDNKLESFTKEAKSFGFYHGTIWYRFEVDTTTTKGIQYINFKDPLKEFATLYVYKDGKLIKTSKSGYNLAKNNRSVKDFSISFELLSNTNAIYLIKTTSSHPHYNSFSFSNINHIHDHWGLYHDILIFVSGIFIALILYNLFLYFIIKDKSYIFYIVYITGLFITNALIYGYLQNFSPSLVPMTGLLIAIALQVEIIGLVFFTEYFLNLKKDTDGKIMKVNRVLLIITVISMFLIPISIGIQLISVITLHLLFFTLIYTGYKKYKAGYKPALFYLIATGVNLIGLILFMSMHQWNFIPYNFFTFHIASIGLVWDMIVLSLALAYKVKLMEEKNIEQERLLMIQARYENIGEITGNIAHQWRTPLGKLGSIFTNISAKSKFKKLDNKELESSIEISSDIIKYLSSTIDTFQNFFKDTKNKEIIFINDFISDILNYIHDSESFKNITVCHDNKNESIKITVNKNEFSQILLSILINAKDALIQNSIKKPYIKISTEEIDKAVFIKIEDNAGGIKPAFIKQIFDPYFSNKENGTGLGLYITKTLADKNNIKLDVINYKNGICFKVIIPK